MADPKIKPSYPERQTLSSHGTVFLFTLPSRSADLYDNWRLSLGLGLRAKEELGSAFCSDAFVCGGKISSFC